jgi:WD40 repeat protein
MTEVAGEHGDRAGDSQGFEGCDDHFLVLKTAKPEQDHGVGCALSPDDRFVAVATSRSKEIKVFKVKGAKEGAQVSFATGHSRPITSLDWSYDGKVR